MSLRLVAAALTAALTLPASLPAGNPATSTWNQFRGPNGSGVAESSHAPPVRIDAAEAAWTIDVPPGHSSPVLSDELLVLTACDDERLITLAFRKYTGDLAWRKEAPEVPLEKVHRAGSPAAPTPCIDAASVYVYFGSYGLLCYDHRGREKWRKPIPTPRSLYGMSTSPILHGDRLILVLDDDANMPGGKLSRSKIICLDKATGDLAWETPRPFHRSGWSTPTIWAHDEGTELVVLGSRTLRGYDAATGEEKWFLGGFSRETVSRPIAAGNRVFASASMLGGVGDEAPDLEPYWNAVMQFDANGDGKLEREEMTGHFTFPFRPDLPPSHPGYGLPLSSDKERRRRSLDGMFRRTDKDRDGFWTKEEFLKNLSFNRAKPNLVAIRPGGHGDVADNHVAWALHRGIPEVPSPVIHQDRIYLVRDGGVLSAVDAGSGKIVYRKRLGASGHYRSSPVVANGHVYAISESGVVSVVKTGSAFELAHQHDLREQVAATPAIDASAIYIRTKTKLRAFRSSGVAPQAMERATTMLRSAVESGQVAGGAHLVQRAGKTCYLETAGLRDIDDRKPFEADTIVRIYSMSKPITSVAAMTLFEQGQFRLDDPVSKFIPAFATTKVLEKDGDAVKLVPAKRAITVRDVFRHTTGYSYGDGRPSPREHYEREGMRYRPPAGMLPPKLTIEQAAAALARIPALHHPGERFTYGFNTDLLGRLIEIWSGQPLDRYLQRAVFAPLEMADTGFSVPEDKRERFASCHTLRDGKLAVVDKAASSPYNEGFEFLSGGGGLVSTIGDYANFCLMLVDGGEFKGKRLLKEETLDLMFTDQLNGVAGGFRFGLGFAIADVPLGTGPAARTATQYSWAGYASTDFRIVPREKLVQIVLRQRVPSTHGLAGKLFSTIYSGVEGD